MIFTVVTLIAVLSAASAETLPPQHGHRVICYLGEIMFHYGRKIFKMVEAEPALHMCTHLLIQCGVIDELDILPFKDSRYNSINDIEELVSMKLKTFPNLKILISVGRVYSKVTEYALMVASQETRAEFVKNVLRFVLENNLDGFDIGWAFSEVTPDFAKNNYNQVLLAKEMREQFDKHGLILSVSVIMNLEGLDQHIDTKRLSEYVHFINIGNNAHRGFNRVVNDHLFYGVPPDKLNFAIFSSGYGYEIKSPNDLKNKTELVNSNGFSTHMPYYEFCKEAEKGGWKRDIDPQIGASYYDNGTMLVINDNFFTVYLKAYYATNKTLGGVAFRSLDTDDYSGVCTSSEGKYPILTKLDNNMVQLSPDSFADIVDSLEMYEAYYFWNGNIIRNDTEVN